MNESILTFRCYRKKYNFKKLKKYIIQILKDNIKSLTCHFKYVMP